MAFNTLEYLEAGKVNFVFEVTSYDRKQLISWIRESERRVSIVNGFLPKLKKKLPNFCFEVIYDIDEFREDAMTLLKKYSPLNKFLQSFTKEFFISFITNSSLAFEYFEQNFDQILIYFQDDLVFVFDFLFKNFDQSFSLLKKLSIHSNLHIRYLFMKYLIQNKFDYIGYFYDDITRFLTDETYENFEQLSFLPKQMSVDDVCDLAFVIFDEKKDYELWLKFKEFILNNYPYNDLGRRLLKLKEEPIGESSYRLVKNQEGIKEFSQDSDRLFQTASQGKPEMLKHYSATISKELLEAYKRKLIYFKQNGILDNSYIHLEAHGLGHDLTLFVEKYLDLSQEKTYEFLGNGSTASCYRIGDFAFKLVRFKWSYEQQICPNLYLILPNLEEKFIRDDKGIVLAGIEVQKYLSRSAEDVPLHIFSRFQEELNRLGYFTTDTLINGKCGDNCRMLDSYKDSSNPNPPTWFKEYPVVLVDRDRVYENGNRYIKQLGSSY